MSRMKAISRLAAMAVAWAACAANAQTWLFDFGSGSLASTPNYNNITNPGVHSFPGLISASGITTPASLAITVPFNTGAPNTNGTQAPPPELGFVANATRDSFFGNVAAFLGQSAPRAQLVVSGLDTTQLYDFTIFASRMGVTDVRQTRYTVTGLAAQTVDLDAANNTSRTAKVIGAQPRADGSIVLDVQAGPANTNTNSFYYLGAMRIDSRPPPVCGGDDPALDDTLKAYPAGGGSYALGHWLYRPAGYSHAPCKKYPLLVFLHGAGERCPAGTLDGLNKSSLNSPGYQIRSRSAYANQRPFLQGLVLQPQTCDGSWTADSIDAMVEYVKSTHRVDEERIYLTGLSLGGGGTWTYASSRPGKLAAIVPIAGTEKAQSLIQAASHVPTWAFHNYNDTNVGPGLAPETEEFRCKSYTHLQCTVEHIDRMIPFASSKVMKEYSPNGGTGMASTHRIATLTSEGMLLPTKWQWESSAVPLGTPGTTMFTVYAASGHGGWSQTYGMQQMWNWMYAQRRPAQPTLNVYSLAVTPSTATPGTTLTITARVSPTSVPLAEVWVDLKPLGGGHATRMTLVAGTSNTYQAVHTVPTTGVGLGVKGLGIVGIDTQGHRTVKFTKVTIASQTTQTSQ